MQEHVEEVVAKLKPYYGLDDMWRIEVVSATIEPGEGRAAAECDPEYSEGKLRIDFDQLHTGDQVEEIIIHELVHMHLMWLHNESHHLSGLAANLVGATHQCNALDTFLKEKVRVAAEKSATDLGHTILRMYRRIQELEAKLGEQDV
jgi:hypothetical protein